MRYQNSLNFFFCLLSLFLFMAAAHGQSSQYKRQKKTATETGTANPPDATKPNQQTEGQKGAAKSDKVDITDLEQKYWAPKDVDFAVVQNRLYSKAGRFGITPSLGPLVTDSFSSGLVYGLSANYYFSERHGVQFDYNKYSLSNSKVVEGFIASNGTLPDFNRQTYFYGVSYNWIPIYAKLSLLDKKILYFDMSISPGIGVMGYEQQVEKGENPQKSSFALTLDIAQHYFLSKEFALRFDMKNRFYNDDVIKYRTLDPVKTKGNHSITILFGLTYYFDVGRSNLSEAHTEGQK